VPDLALVSEPLSDDEVITQVIAAQEAAELREGEAGSALRWAAADGYAVLVERGWSQRKVAAACGTSLQNVNFSVKCVRVYLGRQRPIFQEAYREAQGKTAPRGESKTEHRWKEVMSTNRRLREKVALLGKNPWALAPPQDHQRISDELRETEQMLSSLLALRKDDS